MRSITRSYRGGASCLMPPSFKNSAVTSPLPRSLMFLISASGNDCSRPTKMPTFFITHLSFSRIIWFVAFVHPSFSHRQQLIASDADFGRFEKQADYDLTRRLVNSATPPAELV